MQTQTIIDKNHTARAGLTSLGHHFVPFALLLAMAAAIFLLDAILPLQGLGFSDALLPYIGSWILWPTHLLFPQQAVTSLQAVPNRIAALPSFLALSWNEFFFLFGALMLVFLLYFLALSILPRHVTYRYILGSTLVLGLLSILIPVVTSQDLFLYAGYARMELIYHLDPLTATPRAIHTDPIYSHIFWINQPSIYGPIWIYITAALQWLALAFGFNSILLMVLLLRLFGLAMHLGSTQLLWVLSGRLQRLHGSISPRLRTLAILAFAWNPLLLFEAVVNAHCDTTILFFVLLALWLLVRGTEHGWAIRAKPAIPVPQTGCYYTTEMNSFIPLGAYIGAAVMLALATCIKINIALLVPGLLLYLRMQPRRLGNGVTVAAVYVGTLVVLYAPFWQHGAILHALPANPSSYRDVNTLPEFFSDFYKSLTRLSGYSPAIAGSASSESVTRTLSILIFAAAYSLLCWKTRDTLQTPLDLVRWMALAWLLYCAIGTPWFWPWYTVTFFGLFALVTSIEVDSTREQRLFKALRSPQYISLLTFSMLSLYCFFTLGPLTSFVPWLPRFRWAFLRGLWAWSLPLLALYLCSNTHVTQTYHLLRQRFFNYRHIPE